MTKQPAGGRNAFAAGSREALAAPAAVLGAAYLGFGALAKASGWSVWLTTFSTMAVWALPGQLIALDMEAIGAPAALIILAVFFTNTRFFPMAITLFPVMRDDSRPAWHYYVSAQFIATLCWAVCMRRCPEFEPRDRLAFYLGFAITCWVTCMGTGAIGYALAGSIPPAVRIGLVFMTPVYFVILLIAETRGRLGVMAVAAGAIGGPLFYLLDPEWSLLLAGLVGGTAAYLLHATLVRHD
jgi:predicted branched-subunit amino acid permease